MYNKSNLFFYFCFSLKERYKKLNPNIELNRYHILKMIFIGCIKDQVLINGLGNHNFDNFYAMKKGPVESNCYSYIYDMGGKFEQNLYDEKKLIELIGDVDDSIKDKIDSAISKIDTFLFLQDDNYLIKYTHTFTSWRKAWEKSMFYNKKAYPININDILADGKR